MGRPFPFLHRRLPKTLRTLALRHGRVRFMESHHNGPGCDPRVALPAADPPDNAQHQPL
ncbi:hypothetical protein DFI02_101155 [Rhizobium sp. PP-F2F-G20b]|nr:hypothetical protein DFI02_101155 [Rhizobium sp. PP-F2F-G20b]